MSDEQPQDADKFMDRPDGFDAAPEPDRHRAYEPGGWELGRRSRQRDHLLYGKSFYDHTYGTPRNPKSPWD